MTNVCVDDIKLGKVEPKPSLEDCGLHVVDIAHDVAFRARRLHPREAIVQLEGIRRLARTFVHNPEQILEELVESAIALCGADSAGISLVREGGTDEAFYHWVANAGVYRNFRDAMLPKFPSACGVCLERNRPQHFRVTERFFEILGVKSQPVSDGLLLPWRAGTTVGTIFVLAHGRTEAFDSEDVAVLETLADFAAMGIRQTQQLKQLLLHAAPVGSV